MTNPEHTTTPAAGAPRRALAVAGLVTALLGPVVLVLLIDHPLWRSTGLPAFVAMGLGCVLAAFAWRADRRRVTRILTATTWLLTAVFAWGFFQWARMPEASGFTRLRQAPAFTLPDQDGRPVALAELLRKGPVHLVFYRGFW